MARSPHRIAGASEAFGTRHPGWALLLGNEQAKMHAQVELGKRHWLSTLFGSLLFGLVAVVVFAAAGVWLVRRMPSDWPLWAMGAVVVVGALVWLVRWVRDPLRIGFRRY